MSRTVLALALATVALSAGRALAQPALPTPDAYEQAEPEASAEAPVGETEAAADAAPDEADPPLPPPPDELASPVETPEGYDTPVRPRVRPDGVRVDVVQYGDGPFRLFGRRLDFADPRAELCTAPCTVHLSPGTWEMSVAPMNGGPYTAGQPIRIPSDRNGILNIHYNHRMGIRTVGFTLFHLGLTAVGLSFLGGFFGFLYIGLPVGGTLIGTALPLMFLMDYSRAELFLPPPD